MGQGWRERGRNTMFWGKALQIRSVLKYDNFSTAFPYLVEVKYFIVQQFVRKEKELVSGCGFIILSLLCPSLIWNVYRYNVFGSQFTFRTHMMYVWMVLVAAALCACNSLALDIFDVAQVAIRLLFHRKRHIVDSDEMITQYRKIHSRFQKISSIVVICLRFWPLETLWCIVYSKIHMSI